MKTDSIHSKYIPGEFRWMYWDNQSSFPQTGDGFCYSLSLVLMLGMIINLVQPRFQGLNFEYLFDICCGVISAATWTLLTFVRLCYLRRSLFWAFLILPQPLLFFYLIQWKRNSVFFIILPIILATTLILHLAKPRRTSASQTSSDRQPQE